MRVRDAVTIVEDALMPSRYNDDDPEPGVCANYSHAHEAPDAEAAKEAAQHGKCTNCGNNTIAEAMVYGGLVCTWCGNRQPPGAEPEVGAIEQGCPCDCADEHGAVNKCDCCCHEVDQYALVGIGPWATRYVCCHCYIQEHRRCDGQRGNGESCECARCASDAEGGA